MIQSKVKSSSARCPLPCLSYQNSEATYKIRIEQVEGSIYKMIPIGHMDHVAVTESFKLLEKIILQKQANDPYKGIHIILDETQIVTVSAEAKKYLYVNLRRYCRTGNVGQVAIVSPNPFVRIWARGKYLLWKSANHTFHRTYAGALAKVRGVLYDNHNFQSQREELLKKAKKVTNTELLRMYEQLLDENFDIKTQQQQCIGELYEIAGRFTWDDTKQKAEELIRENQKALSDAHKIARLGSWEFNIHTEELTFSPESLNIIGVDNYKECYKISLEEFIEKLLHPDDVVCIRRHIKKAMRNQDQPNYRNSMEYRLVRHDGKVFTIISYLRFKDHKRGIIYGLSQDITDRKKVIEKLRKQNRELKKVNSELDRFVYSVSHDLRAPLTSVLGLIQVIRRETEISKIMHLLELQEKSINKLDNFIKDIIDLSKNSRIELKREEIHFREMLQNIFEEQSFNKNAGKIDKHIEIEQTVPFFSDGRRINVIFNNLISNAIRYANPQQVHPFVKIIIKIKPECAAIGVHDNGLGIAEEHHNKIFDMFYRASDTISGSGLGLYIVKETLEKLNGTIHVKSAIRKGTEFFLTIPNLHQ